MLTLAQLEIFRRVAERGNFSRAAEDLHVTQPAVSQQVRAIQDYFGLPLVDIVKGRVRLTDAGRFLAARSAEVLAGVAALERGMQEFSTTSAGSLALGATVTIGTHGLAPFLLRFGRLHPRIEVKVTIGNTDSVVEAVRTGNLALALIEGTASGDDLDITEYATDELVLIAPPKSHRFSKRSSVRSGELTGERFVMRERGSGTRRLVEDTLSGAGVTPNNVLELPSGDAIGRAVESGLGISIVSRLVVERDAALGRLRMLRVTDIDLRRKFRLIRARAFTPSPAAASFAQVVTSGTGDETVSG